MTLNEGIKQFRKKHIKPMTKQKKRKSWIGWIWKDVDKITANYSWNSIQIQSIFRKKNRVLGAEKLYRKVRITIEEL